MSITPESEPLTFSTYDGSPCCRCGAKFRVDPVEGTQCVQCPNCHSLIQVTTTIHWADRRYTN